MTHPESNSRSTQEHLDRVYHLLSNFVLKNAIWEDWCHAVVAPGQQPILARRKKSSVLLTPEHPLSFPSKDGSETTRGSGQYTVQAMYHIPKDRRPGQPDLHIGLQLGEQLAQVPDVRPWPHLGPNRWSKLWNPPTLEPTIHYGFDHETHAADDQPRLLQITQTPFDAPEPPAVDILYHRQSLPDLAEPRCAKTVDLIARRLEMALKHSIRPQA